MRRHVIVAFGIGCVVTGALAQSSRDVEQKPTETPEWKWVTNPLHHDWRKPFEFQLLVLPAPDKICRGPAGVLWACGLRAHIALNGFFKHRTAACEIREEADVVVLRKCNAGDVEINHWLLTNGWAELVPEVSDPDLIAAQERARKSLAGIWGNGRTSM